MYPMSDVADTFSQANAFDVKRFFTCKDAKKENNAIEISRSLLLDEEKIFVVKDSILDIIDVNAVYFSDAKVVLKNIPDGTIILSKPVPGAYAGMMVKTLKNKKDNNSSKPNKTK